MTKKKIIKRKIEFYACSIFKGTKKLTRLEAIYMLENMLLFHKKENLNKIKYSITKSDGLDWIIELIENNPECYIFKIKSEHSAGNIEKTDKSTFNDSAIELEENDIIDQYTFLAIDKNSLIAGFMNYNSRGHYQILNKMLWAFNKDMEIQFDFVPDKDIFDNILRQKNIVLNYAKIREEQLEHFTEIKQIKDFLLLSGIDIVIKLKPTIGGNLFKTEKLSGLIQFLTNITKSNDGNIKSIKGEAIMNDETSKNIDLFGMINPFTKIINLEIEEDQRIPDVVRNELYEKFIKIFKEGLPEINNMIDISD